MRFTATPVPLDAIRAMRDAYRRDMACQVVHDSWHARGFATSYLLHADGAVAGYGSVGGAPRDPKDTVKELYLVPERRGDAVALFGALVAASGARTIEAQTNDPLLLGMLLDFADGVEVPTILFADGLATAHAPAGARFRALTEREREAAFPHTHEPVGEYGVVLDGRVVATGGMALHYNPPYADLFMEVHEPYRRRGLGSYLVQELKRACRQGGHLPAARCGAGNTASRRTLERAGMLPCARIVRGTLARLPAPGP